MKLGLAVLLVSGLASVAAAAERCPPLPAKPLPPITDQPVSDQSLAASRRAAKLLAKERAEGTGRFADERECVAESGTSSSRIKMLVECDELVRREPADLRARLELIVEMRDAIREDWDTCTGVCVKLRQQLVEAVVQLRDGAYAGSKSCAGWLSRLNLTELLGGLEDAPEMARLADTFQHGPPGKIGDATRAVLAWLAHEHGGPGGPDADRDGAEPGARHIGSRTRVRIEDQLYSSGSDHPRVTLGRRWNLQGREGIGKWETPNGEFPVVGDVMWCDVRCCHWPFHDPTPHHLQFVDLCFDASLHLTLIRTRLSGM